MKKRLKDITLRYYYPFLMVISGEIIKNIIDFRYLVTSKAVEPSTKVILPYKAYAKKSPRMQIQK